MTESLRAKAASGQVKTAAVDCMTAICNCTGNRHDEINMQQREHSSDKVRSRSFVQQDGMDPDPCSDPAVVCSNFAPSGERIRISAALALHLQ